jgi:hypothetical protein
MSSRPNPASSDRPMMKRLRFFCRWFGLSAGLAFFATLAYLLAPEVSDGPVPFAVFIISAGLVGVFIARILSLATTSTRFAGLPNQLSPPELDALWKKYQGAPSDKEAFGVLASAIAELGSRPVRPRARHHFAGWLAGAVVMILALSVWPTLYFYEPGPKNQALIKVNRVTGHAEYVIPKRTRAMNRRHDSGGEGALGTSQRGVRAEGGRLVPPCVVDAASVVSPCESAFSVRLTSGT